MKKGRHRRFEEARALKQNQDIALDSICASLHVDDADTYGESSDFEAGSDESEEDEDL